MASVNLGKVVGDSAYEVAVANGFVGTEAEWLASLKGTDGTDGFSPIANVTQDGDVTTITITDALGTTTASFSTSGGSSYTDEDTAAYIQNTFGMGFTQGGMEPVSEDSEAVIVDGSGSATLSAPDPSGIRFLTVHLWAHDNQSGAVDYPVSMGG
jgi:hypothetical protein